MKRDDPRDETRDETHERRDLFCVNFIKVNDADRRTDFRTGQAKSGIAAGEFVYLTQTRDQLLEARERQLIRTVRKCALRRIVDF